MVELRRCDACGLLFRWPLDGPSATRLYERRYREGLTTELPQPADLEQMLATSFAATPHDMAAKIQVLRRLAPPPRRVLDFGASWGYGTWQLQQAGYDAVGFEVSRHRAAFGAASLGVKITSDWEDLPPSFDVVYSNHVLEHVGYDMKGTLARLAGRCGEGALMMHIVPHFEGYLARGRLAPMMGEVHPVGPTARFLSDNFKQLGFTDVRTSTGPFDDPASLRADEKPGPDGEELLVIAARPPRV